METICDRYELVSLLGAGGMGEVFLAQDRVLGRRVAVKRIRPDSLESDGVAAERFMREARAAALVQHPNVVAVHDLVIDQGRTYIVMEYVEARTLADLVRSDGGLAPPRVADLGAQIADALAAAHLLGVVHRDVKPANIMVESSGRVRLADFGVARRLTDSGLTGTGSVIGSIAFMAPEVAEGSEATTASDVYSLGATLFHALEGHAPHALPGEANTSVGMLARLVTRPAPACRAGTQLGALIDAMLAREPVLRPASSDLRARLLAVATSAEAQASWTESTTPTLLRDLPPAAQETRLRPGVPAGPSGNRTLREEPGTGHTVLRVPQHAAGAGTPASGLAGRSARRPPAKIALIAVAALLAVGGGWAAAVAAGLMPGSGSAVQALPAPGGGDSRSTEPATPSSTPTPDGTPGTPTPVEAPAPVGFACWDGGEADALTDCKPPRTRDETWKYLRYAYPSVAGHKTCEKSESKHDYKGVTVSWSCKLNATSLLRYRYWAEPTDADRHYAGKYKKYTMKTYDVSIGSEPVAGWYKFSDRPVSKRTNGSIWYLSTMWLPELGLSLSAEGKTPADVWEALELVRIRPPEQVKGHPLGEDPAETELVMTER